MQFDKTINDKYRNHVVKIQCGQYLTVFVTYFSEGNIFTHRFKMFSLLTGIDVNGIQNFEPFIRTTIPKNGRDCLPICGETEGTLSSTLCRFLMYFVLTLYSLNRLSITPP